MLRDRRRTERYRTKVVPQVAWSNIFILSRESAFRHPLGSQRRQGLACLPECSLFLAQRLPYQISYHPSRTWDYGYTVRREMASIFSRVESSCPLTAPIIRRAHRAIAKKWLDKGPVKSRTDELVLECNNLLQQLSVVAEPVRLIDRYVVNNILRISFGADKESLGSAKYNEVLEMIWGFMLVEQWLTMSEKSGTDSDAGTARILRRIQLTFSHFFSICRVQVLQELNVVGIIGGILVRLYLDGILTHLFTVSPKHMIVSSLPKAS